MAVMADRENSARDVADQLGVSLSTLYAYVDGHGQPKDALACSWRHHTGEARNHNSRERRC